MIWLKRIAIVVVIGAVLGFYGFEFLYFLSYPVATRIKWADGWLVLLIFFFSVGALVKLRWRWIASFAIAWVLIFLPELGVRAPFRWLTGQGFHVRTLLDDSYLSRCHLTDFVEKGSRQTVGLCEKFDRVEICQYIMYDPTGQFMLPDWQRTPEWKRAVSALNTSSAVIPELDAWQLFGNFYDVTTIRSPGC